MEINTPEHNFVSNTVIMRVKQGFVLRDMCGEHIVSAEGIGNFDFNKVISLNDTAAYLWNAVSGRDFDEGLLAELLLERYAVDAPTAAKDASALCARWKEAGLLE